VVDVSAEADNVVGTSLSALAHHEKDRPPMRIPPASTTESLRIREVTEPDQDIHR
jgi:hypothetical protein